MNTSGGGHLQTNSASYHRWVPRTFHFRNQSNFLVVQPLLIKIQFYFFTLIFFLFQFFFFLYVFCSLNDRYFFIKSVNFHTAFCAYCLLLVAYCPKQFQFLFCNHQPGTAIFFLNVYLAHISDVVLLEFIHIDFVGDSPIIPKPE